MIKNFIESNNITQVYNSRGTNTNPKGYPKYKSNEENTLFWGMYNEEDIQLCINHIGKKWVYWHYNDCNYKYKYRRYNVKLIKKLDNVIHLCNNNSAKFLDFFKINYIIICDSYISYEEPNLQKKK